MRELLFVLFMTGILLYGCRMIQKLERFIKDKRRNSSDFTEYETQKRRRGWYRIF